MGTKKIVKELEKIVGSYGAGLLVAIMCDTVHKATEKAGGNFNVRSVKITLNDYFDLRADIETGEYSGNLYEEQN